MAASSDGKFLVSTFGSFLDEMLMRNRHLVAKINWFIFGKSRLWNIFTTLSSTRIQ
jgi:hypothetical protein